jgi:hypothetical protein
MDALLAYGDGDDSDQESGASSPNTSSRTPKDNNSISGEDGSFFIEGEGEFPSGPPTSFLFRQPSQQSDNGEQNSISSLSDVNLDHERDYESKLLNKLYPKPVSREAKDQQKYKMFQLNLRQVILDKTDITQVITSSREFGNPEALQWVIKKCP